jgi:hypothetical protein
VVEIVDVEELVEWEAADGVLVGVLAEIFPLLFSHQIHKMKGSNMQLPKGVELLFIASPPLSLLNVVAGESSDAAVEGLKLLEVVVVSIVFDKLIEFASEENSAAVVVSDVLPVVNSF